MRFCAVVVVLVGLSTLAYAQAPPQRGFVLVCHYSNAPTFGDNNLEVDLIRNTANGYPATIDEGQITWSAENKDGNLRNTVNRYTGTISTVVTYKGKETTLVGVCEKPPARKF